MKDDPIPYGYCQCGCGGLAPISPYTSAPMRYVKNMPRYFIQGHATQGRRRLAPIADGRDWLSEDRSYKTPCWTWQRRLTSKGYGSAYSYHQSKSLGAHIASYEEAYGPVPEGLQIDHLCKNRACVNPEHLEAVTPLVNSRRRVDAKLDDEKRAEIVLIHAAGGRSLRSIGREFGVDVNVIIRVITIAQRLERAAKTGKPS